MSRNNGTRLVLVMKTQGEKFHETSYHLRNKTWDKLPEILLNFWYEHIHEIEIIFENTNKMGTNGLGLYRDYSGLWQVVNVLVLSGQVVAGWPVPRLAGYLGGLHQEDHQPLFLLLWGKRRRYRRHLKMCKTFEIHPR